MLHVGYYIIGKERTIEVPNHGIECERDASHSFAAGANFCSECGGMMVISNAVIMEPTYICDIPEEEGCIEDHFLFPEYTPAKEGEVIGVSNFRGCGHFEILDEDVIIDLDAGTMTARKQQQYDDFINRHSCDIKLLRKYVYDDLEIKYGMFEYDY